MSNLFLFDVLAAVMAGLIAVVAVTVFSFSRRYMDGDKHYTAFFGTLAVLVLASLTVVSANHIAVLGGAWIVMSLALSRMIGHVRGWQQAKAAERIALFHLLPGAAVLIGGLGILSWQTDEITISAISEGLAEIEGPWLVITASLIVLSAVIQSALFPFHRWILASMTAPTPVSALMHAGIVNAGGFLIVRFYEVFALIPESLLVLFAIGGVSALLASFWMLTQTDIKRALGCSTVAQMGFMIMQCGLGFYTAAIAHLILHGFFKAYHFLAAGSAIQNAALPQKDSPKGGLSTAALVILSGVTAGGLFMMFTGKAALALDAGSILTLFVVLAAIQAAQEFSAMKHLNFAVQSAMLLALIGLSVSIYAGIFIGLNQIMPINAPQELVGIHIVFTGLATILWLFLASGLHKRLPWLYMWLYMSSLNQAQAAKSSILQNRSVYNAG